MPIFSTDSWYLFNIHFVFLVEPFQEFFKVFYLFCDNSLLLSAEFSLLLLQQRRVSLLVRPELLLFLCPAIAYRESNSIWMTLLLVHFITDVFLFECLFVILLIFITTNAFSLHSFQAVVVVLGYPTPSKGWAHGGRSWSPRSRATLQDLDQKS